MNQEKEQAKDPSELSGKYIYINPVDGYTYESEGQWKTYNKKDTPHIEGRILLKPIILLSNQNDMERIVGIERLASFIKLNESVIKKELSGIAGEGEVLIQFTLNTNTTEIQMSFKGGLDSETLGNVLKELMIVCKHQTSFEDQYIYQLHYQILPEKRVD